MILNFLNKKTLSSLYNLGQIQIACIQYKVLKHNVLTPDRHSAIGGTSIKFFKSSSPLGDRRQRSSFNKLSF